ncbi:MAG: hypothetical protein JKY37_21380, partial [Nannocystaceae bacterium]|nr:hypothetical protein [Nannocystaceae bacterium]
TARVWRAESGKPWRLSLSTGAEGTREVQADSCAALADATVVMIEISLNPVLEESTAREPDDEAAQVPSPPPPTEPPASVDKQSPTPVVRPNTSLPSTPRSNAPASDSAPTRRKTWARPQAVLGIMTGGHGVGLPAPGVGLGGRLGVRWGPLQLAAVGVHWVRRPQATQGITAVYTLSTGGVEMCGVVPGGERVATFEGIACGAIELGRLQAQGRNTILERERRHLWVAPGAGVGVLWVPRPIIGIGIRADVFVPTLRRRFLVGEAAVGTVGPVDARGTLVVEIRLPNISPST